MWNLFGFLIPLTDRALNGLNAFVIQANGSPANHSTTISPSTAQKIGSECTARSVSRAILLLDMRVSPTSLLTVDSSCREIARAMYGFGTGKPAHDGVVIDCEWNPHETSKVATCSWDGTIKYWD
ncbi:hypothetical protein BC937DRAFT_89276 [Endogone sp. FLAS-F59071]|nr:hypothetical protein BC937DRAFT_89276 [Endogone sp. FLAS-F59071]|eukprot:RUS23283.1 hypothetical protein BC937DRAFT_89276 [Endogone sp. FLAS-F59071]